MFDSKKYKRSEKEFSPFSLDYIDIGWYTIIPILFFLGIGIWIRKHFVNSKWIIVIFIILGAISSFYNIIKLIWKK